MNKIVFAILVIITTALMGSSFAIGKLGIVYTSPILLVALRFLIAGSLMIFLVKIMGRPHPKGIDKWLKISAIGLTQTAGVMGCIFVGLRTISSGELSILTFMNPLLVVILGTFLLKIRYTARQWIGVTLGFVGVFITLGAHFSFKVGTVLGFASAVSWAIATLLIKKWGNHFDIWVLSAYQMFLGGIFLLIASFLFEKPFFIITKESIFILFWLAIMASIVQFSVWFYLLQKGEPGRTSAFLFLAPFFGVLSGWLILGEEIKWFVMIGGLFIFTGIFLVNWTATTKVT